MAPRILAARDFDRLRELVDTWRSLAAGIVAALGVEQTPGKATAALLASSAEEALTILTRPGAASEETDHDTILDETLSQARGVASVLSCDPTASQDTRAAAWACLVLLERARGAFNALHKRSNDMERASLLDDLDEALTQARGIAYLVSRDPIAHTQLQNAGWACADLLDRAHDAFGAMEKRTSGGAS